MPTYLYTCTKCEHEFETYRSVDGRYTVRCPKCWGEVRIRIGEGVAVRIFEPHYNTQLGCHVNSNREKQMILKERGLTSVGDADYDQVAKQAQYNKKHAAQEERKTKVRKFSEDWQDRYSYTLKRKSHGEDDD